MSGDLSRLEGLPEMVGNHVIRAPVPARQVRILSFRQKVTPAPDGFGSDRNRYFIVDKCNTGLMDLFLTQARKAIASLQAIFAW